MLGGGQIRAEETLSNEGNRPLADPRCLSDYGLHIPNQYLVSFRCSRVLAPTVELRNSHRCDLGHMFIVDGQLA